MFAPLAWLKLKFFCHAGDTEVGGFAVSAEHDPLYVRDFATVRQYTTAVSVEFDDAAVADHFDDAVDAGLAPARFARIWCHTHPGDSPEPSTTDEHTSARVFGACDWSVMFILSRTGRAYARLNFSAGPGGAVLLPVAVDWEAWPAAVLEHSDELAGLLAAWAAEFDRNVHPVCPLGHVGTAAASGGWPRSDEARFPRLADGAAAADPWSGLDELQAAFVEDEYLEFADLASGAGQGSALVDPVTVGPLVERFAEPGREVPRWRS